MTVEAYPLHWPEGWKRTPAHRRVRSAFKAGFIKARDGLVLELRRMGAKNVVISSGIPVRLDGIPYANHRQPADPGIAVYFQRGGRSLVFACDRWLKVEENLHAVRLSIEAIRGIERWGASDMMERAFTGFAALPPAQREWWAVLQVSQTASIEECRTARNNLARLYHPDSGTSPNAERMASVNEAYEKRVSLGLHV